MQSSSLGILSSSANSRNAEAQCKFLCLFRLNLWTFWRLKTFIFFSSSCSPHSSKFRFADCDKRKKNIIKTGLGGQCIQIPTQLSDAPILLLRFGTQYILSDLREYGTFYRVKVGNGFVSPRLLQPSTKEYGFIQILTLSLTKHLSSTWAPYLHRGDIFRWTISVHQHNMNSFRHQSLSSSLRKQGCVF